MDLLPRCRATLTESKAEKLAHVLATSFYLDEAREGERGREETMKAGVGKVEERKKEGCEKGEGHGLEGCKISICVERCSH